MIQGKFSPQTPNEVLQFKGFKSFETIEDFGHKIYKQKLRPESLSESSNSHTHSSSKSSNKSISTSNPSNPDKNSIRDFVIIIPYSGNGLLSMWNAKEFLQDNK